MIVEDIFVGQMVCKLTGKNYSIRSHRLPYYSVFKISRITNKFSILTEITDNNKVSKISHCNLVLYYELFDSINNKHIEEANFRSKLLSDMLTGVNFEELPIPNINNMVIGTTIIERVQPREESIINGVCNVTYIKPLEEFYFYKIKGLSIDWGVCILKPLFQSIVKETSELITNLTGHHETKEHLHDYRIII